MWLQLSIQDKKALIAELQLMRSNLIVKAKNSRSKATATATAKASKISFKSKELEELFNSMPKEIQKYIAG